MTAITFSVVILAKAGIPLLSGAAKESGIPAFAGMTGFVK